MQIPSLEKLPNEPIFTEFARNDAQGFMSPKRTNKSFLNKRRVHTAIELFQKYLPQSSREIRVADFACGTGNFGLSLLEQGYHVDFVDYEEKFFEYIKLKNTTSYDPAFIKADASVYRSEQKYHGIYLGEAIEHMAHPDKALKAFYENLLPGGVLCLTTPNGDYENCQEPCWEEVKDKTERNEKLANTIGNHVCEFKKSELAELVKLAGFGLHEHKLVNSTQISRRSLLRRALPMAGLFKLDDHWSKRKNVNGKDYGRIQIIVAQRFH